MALDLFRQIISAVAACEATRVVHRDLSPDNILVLPDGTIKVIDFGLCQIEGQQPVTLVDEGVGTINYMAPECESGAEGRESTASDVYSAGKILWSAITGQKAFAREAPVFGNKSMKTLFANSPETWHLNVIFERTIRPRPDDRDSPQHLLWLTDTVRRLILAGRPPLELILRRCTACGLGDLVEDRHGHLLFANPPPKGVVYVHCNYCGYCFAVRRNVIQENLTKRTARD